MSTPWLRLLPDENYRFQMGLRPGDAAAFYAPSDAAAEILAQRRALLRQVPQSYVLNGAADDALRMLAAWTGGDLPDVIAAGCRCEPDWVLLAPDAAGGLRVTAGVVCFPSSWSLPEKAGLRVSEVHAPVPGLNDTLARRIDTFLARLAPGSAWERDNWGLSADDALDHHPRHTLPALTGAATLETSWLRLERQTFVPLAGGAVLFGIRVSVHRLDELAALPGVASRLARALETMPAEVAAYKGVTAARGPLAAQLRARA